MSESEDIVLEVALFLVLRFLQFSALFFFAYADGRIGVGVGAGGAEDFGSFSSGATDAVALTYSLTSGA